MILIEDTRNKVGEHKNVADYCKRHGITLIREALKVGDYMFPDGNVSVDTKKNMNEVYGNLCHDHKRFKAELIRANDLGIKLIILVEHGGAIRTLESVREWTNPRLKYSPYAWNGERLCGVMRTVADRYGVEWEFCDKRQTGKRIIEILGGQT